jgi:hypothetical protein
VTCKSNAHKSPLYARMAGLSDLLAILMWPASWTLTNHDYMSGLLVWAPCWLSLSGPIWLLLGSGFPRLVSPCISHTLCVLMRIRLF